MARTSRYFVLPVGCADRPLLVLALRTALAGDGRLREQGADVAGGEPDQLLLAELWGDVVADEGLVVHASRPAHFVLGDVRQPVRQVLGDGHLVGGDREAVEGVGLELGQLLVRLVPGLAVIRWEDGTRFDDARKWAATAWYNSDYNLKKVKIAPDAWNTITDLEWQDDTRKDVSWVAQWRGRHGADSIVMNRAFLDDGKKYGNKAARRKAAAHEMGHALGLDHKANGTLMSKTMGGIPSNARPTATDRNGYHKLWD